MKIIYILFMIFGIILVSIDLNKLLNNEFILSAKKGDDFLYMGTIMIIISLFKFITLKYKK